MYEDAGEGFQYKKGEYKTFDFSAQQVGATVKVTVTPKSGLLKPTTRKYKVCVITDKGTTEGNWTSGSVISLILKDNN